MDKELTDAAANFVYYFRLVFDHDWDFTQHAIKSPDFLIDGTFLEPKVEDEENNWANRARVLESYRELKALLESRGVNTDPTAI